MAYATVEEFRAFPLSLGADENRDDATLARLLKRAQAFIEGPQCCNRRFEAESDSTRYFEVGKDTDGLTLRLDYDLAQAPSEVKNGDGSVIASNHYILLPRNVTPYYEIRLKQTAGIVWQYGDDPDNPIEITGRWAYSLKAPDDIKQGTLLLAAWLYRQAGASSDVDRAIATAEGLVIMPSALPKAFWDFVGGYKRR